MERIVVDGNTRVLVLTGAGVSAESGIPTFRDANGLWENHPVEQVASPEGFAADPLLVWRFYSQRREGALQCRPNPGHRALAALGARRSPTASCSRRRTSTGCTATRGVSASWRCTATCS
jgi:NAD-dependent SIR2 family protein deacetylase